MKILVTGAAGFIGSHTAIELIKRGHDVVGVDNMNSYYNIELKQDRLKNIRRCCKEAAGRQGVKAGSFTFRKADIADKQTMERLFKREKFHKVCNLAAQAGVRYSFENPMSYIQSNIIGFLNILQLCTEHKIKHLVYASSSSVYGNSATIPFNESDLTDSPESLYAATKKSNELLSYFYRSQYGLNSTGLRFFTVYGPWGRPDMAPFLFVKNILEGAEIKLFNRGNLSRDFSYIADIVTGVVKVLEGPNKSPHPIYNIGNGKPVELKEFIETIEKIASKKAKKRLTAMQPGDVYTTFADTSLLVKDYGFKPNTPLKEGIEEFYRWFKSYYKQ